MTGGINGAELLGLLTAAQTASPGSPFRVDCQAVQAGVQRGMQWATAPGMKLARAWRPLAAAVNEHTENVVLMPAHCAAEDIGVKRLSDGSRLSRLDWHSNAQADTLATHAAQAVFERP